MVGNIKDMATDGVLNAIGVGNLSNVAKIGVQTAVRTGMDAGVDMLAYGKTERNVFGRGLMTGGLALAQFGVGELGVSHGREG